ncbi:MAG: S46 family peptidase [Bacteroidales bacterium]|nr:S46 family peptidase [Bacteroidales bacterium]
MKKILVAWLFTYVFAWSYVPPDEGMWLLMYIAEMNYQDMKKLGLNLTPEQIYSIDKPSIKDAIVGLGNSQTGGTNFFCTGVVVSPQGLIFTNHHCGYDAIQSVSTLEHDYLTNGFWAKSLEEEIPIKDMTISFFVRMENVTDQVLKGVTEGMSSAERGAIVNKNIKKIEKDASEKGKYDVVVKEMFEGNEYYLFVYHTYKDVRLVGTPPSNIGKFGGDTDNWMWPRHTGDFSIFRVYAAPDGSPAEYSKNNVPLKPKYYLPVSIKGVHKNDFTMIFGFPGQTQRYLTSYGIKLALDQDNPTIVKIRDKKLAIMKKYMDADPKTKLQYASKYAQTANYWKYFIGQSKGLKRWNVMEERRKLENEFLNWVYASLERQKVYGNVMKDFEEGYKNLKSYTIAFWYLNDGIFQGPEFIYNSFLMAFQLNNLLEQQSKATKNEKNKFADAIKSAADEAIKKAEDYFKNYNPALDKEIFVEMMKMYIKDVPDSLQASVIKDQLYSKKFKGDVQKWADYVYSTSIFVNQEKCMNFLKNPSYKVISKDPGFAITISFIENIRFIYGKYSDSENKIKEASRLFIRGLREMNPNKKFYPDANSSLRMTYGTVQDYYPYDAVKYDYRTTYEGILQKEDPDNEEFIVDSKLKELFLKKDFGSYAENGNLYVCFITNNDITGGNSGSPVLNGNGELIGLAFDGNWEGMSSDIQYQPEVQRTISVDIRYVLFVIEKLGDAKNIINELTIVR